MKEGSCSLENVDNIRLLFFYNLHSITSAHLAFIIFNIINNNITNNNNKIIHFPPFCTVFFAKKSLCVAHSQLLEVLPLWGQSYLST